MVSSLELFLGENDRVWSMKIMLMSDYVSAVSAKQGTDQ